MTGKGEYNPGNRKETPEEKVDRLIDKTENSIGNSSCADLQEALGYINPDDTYRRTRANNVLMMCREEGYL